MANNETIALYMDDCQLGRDCIICGETILLRSVHDLRSICPSCLAFLNEWKKSHKSNWIPNSKGGEPNHL